MLSPVEATSKIFVTKTYLPAQKDYQSYLDQIWASNWVTNNGPLVQKLEEQLCHHLDLNHFQYVSNGTTALQLALKVLGVTGDIITTPFSYVATTNSIFWENCRPVFVDIEADKLCLNAEIIEEAITPETTAILATHVFGLPCAVEEIEAVAKKHKLKVIYDAAHAFGVKYKGRSLLSFGDASTVSLHATKVFHTIEGGGVIMPSQEMDDKIYAAKAFGHVGDDFQSVGINGKNSEFHAAIGLCNLKVIDQVIERRKFVTEAYDSLLDFDKITPLKPGEDVEYNYGYYPVIFESEEALLKVFKGLEGEEVYARRYFYPSLNKLPFHTGADCPVSEDISKRIACLPLYHDLALSDVERIAHSINQSLAEQ